MLSTVDNPFNPFTQFDDWYRFDEENGYHCCSYLARVSNSTEEVEDELFNRHNEEAIDDILRLHNYQIYKKVVEDDEKEGIGGVS